MADQDRIQDSAPNTNEEKLEELLVEAEQRFRKGVALLNEWGDQARDLIQKRPGVVLAGVAVLGFVTGLLLRRGAEGSVSEIRSTTSRTGGIDRAM